MPRPNTSRRRFLRDAALAAAAGAIPPSIARALAISAAPETSAIQDVRHVVILMMENRSFDHYFGTLRGVRGFADHHPIPLSGRPVWQQSDGAKEILPFHLDSQSTSALKVASTPHNFADTQAALGQGRLDRWPQFKTPLSMGHYQRVDIPFQFALAEAFTICDAYHCSVTTGTDPNRIVFWSGSNADPERRRRGENCTDADAEPDNLRCWLKGGTLPEPGYAYQGSPFTWPTIPEVLEAAKVNWRIYQDPNDNWTGLMHGGLAFESFRTAKPGSPLYEKGMTSGWLDALADDVRRGQLPQVSWVLPSQTWSENPFGSSPVQGAEFTSRVLDALTANPKVWARTVFFLTFDENDGLFDHVPPPAPPSFNPDGALAGKATLPLEGMYFSDAERKYHHPEDPYDFPLRPWGLGPRVPMYVISPWSKGGWVNSQVFDHTSVGRFIEKRFGITIPAISPWHRAVCGDLTSCLDLSARDDRVFPKLPRIRNGAALAAASERKPPPAPPAIPEPLFQEPGVRASRALPYRLEVDSVVSLDEPRARVIFRNDGDVGAVFHVYDRLHLDRIPRRYTVEAGRTLDDDWNLADDEGRYNLWVYGPNGFVREVVGRLTRSGPRLETVLRYDVPGRALRLSVINSGADPADFVVRANAYRAEPPWMATAPPIGRIEHRLALHKHHNWYDFTVAADGFERRFAGRMETGRHDISDPHE